MKSRCPVWLVALVCCTGLTGCGVLPGGGDDSPTVTVWLMKDSVSDDFLQRFVSTYERQHPSVTLDVRIQEWTGIGDKVLTAIGGDDAPDVIEVGNTQVAQYAESGDLRDLTLEVGAGPGQRRLAARPRGAGQRQRPSSASPGTPPTGS